jgi:asparagine synthase (glutamine-hydrolysing)
MCGIWGILSLEKINYDQELLYKKFMQIKSRGPDRSVYITNSNYIVGFHRLAIMDTSSQGDQPFSLSYYYSNKRGENILRTVYVIVNGEIYNWEKLRSDHDIQEYCAKINYKYKSNSDCEVILPMFLRYISDDSYSEDSDIFKNGLKELLTRLDGEFAFAIYDHHHNITTNKTYYNLWIGRDRFGIRPGFFSKLDSKTIVFGSELKSITGIIRSELLNQQFKSVQSCQTNRVEQIDPRSWYYWGGLEGSDISQSNQFYYSVGNLPMVRNPDPTDVYRMCRNLLTKAVTDRLHSDREVGCLLSGGLDSSLVAAIASAELKKQGRVLRTFSIGMEGSPDVHYAKIVAKHIGSSHTNFDVPQDEWVNAIKDVIKIAETFDITTVRATTGQYLVCKKIAETTDIKVLLIGDGSDEATGGYLYFHKAPNPTALHFETQRLLHWIHYFDVLRADRGVASNGLEARVPFLAHQFIDFYFQVDPVLRICRPHTLSTGQTNVYEKYLLRKSFDSTGLLPECVLWRKKEAFSDGVSSESKSWYQIVQEMADKKITDEQFEYFTKMYYQNYVDLTGEKIVIPHTKEALYYHMIFDEFYPGQYHTIPYYWMPKWIEGATDPSARTLQIYKEVEKDVANIPTNSSKSNYGAMSIPV